jgi:hypothetical protein
MENDDTVEAMANDDIVEAEEQRRIQLYIDDEDLMVRVLKLPEGDYEIVTVNSSWLERGFLEGDVILFAEDIEPDDGDIVLIEEDGLTRLGVASAPGYLLTLHGARPLDPGENIVGVGMGLSRRLRKP